MRIRENRDIGRKREKERMKEGLSDRENVREIGKR